MIRRLLLGLALVAGALLATAAPAGADSGANVLCLYRGAPLHQGLCIRL